MEHDPSNQETEHAPCDRPVLITQRLVVRPFHKEDGEDLFEYLSNEAVYRFEPGEPLDRKQAQDAAIAMSLSPEFWAVELQAKHKVIGQIYFKQEGPLEVMTWELGYILSPYYQRQGFATEAVLALLQYGFNKTGIHRVVAHCNPENVASWKLLEKLGFRREGLLKKEIFFRLDANSKPLWTDTFVYALLEEEYLQEGSIT